MRVFPEWIAGAVSVDAGSVPDILSVHIRRPALTATDPAPHVYNASMGARLEVLYASPQIVAQRRRFRELLGVRAGESGVDVGCGVGHLTCELAEDVDVDG